MRRVLTVVSALGLTLAGCAHSRGDTAEVDPDLQPLAREEAEPTAVIEPDERIGVPDAPGVELIGERAPAPKGDTQYVEMEGEAATNPAVAGQPKRHKPGSFMTGIRYAPNK